MKTSKAKGQALVELAIVVPILLAILAGGYVACRTGFIASAAESAAHQEAVRSGRRLPPFERELARTILPGGGGVRVRGTTSRTGWQPLPAAVPGLAGRSIGIAEADKTWNESGIVASYEPLRLSRRSEQSVDCWDRGSASGRRISRVVKGKVLLGAVR